MNSIVRIIANMLARIATKRLLAFVVLGIAFIQGVFGKHQETLPVKSQPKSVEVAKKIEIKKDENATNKYIKAKVVAVSDGDTLKIRLADGTIERLRLIGVDTPESSENEKAMLDAERTSMDIDTIISLGKASFENTKALLKNNETVSIEFDVQQRDQYKRLLGYVYLSNGKMLNSEILSSGYGRTLTHAPDVKYADVFHKLVKDAKAAKRGLWKEVELLP